MTSSVCGEEDDDDDDDDNDGRSLPRLCLTLSLAFSRDTVRPVPRKLQLIVVRISPPNAFIVILSSQPPYAKKTRS